MLVRVNKWTYLPPALRLKLRFCLAEAFSECAKTQRSCTKMLQPHEMVPVIQSPNHPESGNGSETCPAPVPAITPLILGK